MLNTSHDSIWFRRIQDDVQRVNLTTELCTSSDLLYHPAVCATSNVVVPSPSGVPRSGVQNSNDPNAFGNGFLYGFFGILGFLFLMGGFWGWMRWNRQRKGAKHSADPKTGGAGIELDNQPGSRNIFVLNENYAPLHDEQ